jgi:hypothetical protein
VLPLVAARPVAAAADEDVFVVAGSAVLAGGTAGGFERVAALPAPRTGSVLFADRDSLWVIGGRLGGQPTDEIVRIDRRSHQVLTGSRFEEPLAEAGFASAQGSFYVVGGSTGKQLATAVLRVSPPGGASLVGRLPAGTRAAAVGVVGARLIVAGGVTTSGPTRAIYAVDLQSGSVTRIGSLPQPIAGAAIVRLAGALYLLGGTGPGGAVSTAIVRIDPVHGTATAVGNAPAAAAGAAGVTTGAGALLVAGRTVYRLGA